MIEFFRFPHTPHLMLIGNFKARNDKVIASEEVTEFLSSNVIVEEKVDGANIGLSLSENGEIRVQNRGSFLSFPYSHQFSRLAGWVGEHEDGLRKVLSGKLIIFGEWCAARHSKHYSKLPDWFLLFDVYDVEMKKFWSVERRNDLAFQAGLVPIREVCRGQMNSKIIVEIVLKGESSYRDGKMEGVVVRKEDEGWCVERAKVVHPDFIQEIDSHWRSRSIEWNMREQEF